MTQLAIFGVVSLTAGTILTLHYIQLPNLIFGTGQYQVRLELPRAAGLYRNANVTYRGTEVGHVGDVQLTDSGVQADLELDSGVAIPSNVEAQVHSTSAIGEQYVALLPRDSTSRPLKAGDVIPVGRATVPPDINTLVEAANRGVQAIPQENLRTAIDEAYTAVGGLGPELSRLVTGSTDLAIDARANLDPLTNLIDHSKPVLDSQADSAGSIRAWAANLANITDQLRTHDSAVAAVLTNGGPAADEARQLMDRLRPTLPLLLANLVSVNQIALTYHPALEQILVLLPLGIANLQGSAVANLNTKQAYAGPYLDFKLNLNLPPACTTGFLPVQQQRSPVFEDAPERPSGDLYCRVPQDSPFNVRGVRNTPCMTVPGKRAPTPQMCESNQQYVPLNDGYNWKGDPNATLSGQDVPQQSAAAAPPVGAPPADAGARAAPSPTAAGPPLIAAAEYDPATGTYVGPDGHLYTQSDLAGTEPAHKSWQSMLIPPNH